MGRRRLTTIVLIGLLLLTSSALGRNRRAAREAYKKALEYHHRLLEIPERKRTLRNYSSALFLYRRVIDFDPTYGACDDALFAIASLYDEMARRFKNDKYRNRAIYYYRFMTREYPLTKHKRPALRRVAKLKSQKIPDQKLSEGTIVVSADKTPAKSKVEISPAEAAKVSEVRYWSNEEYTRVVIQLDREVKFERHVLVNPDRVYFDLNHSRLDSNLEGKSYKVNDVFLKSIRLAQNRPDVVRVVLDFEKIREQTVFELYDPFRIVIDTHRTPRQAGKSEAGKKGSAQASISKQDQANTKEEWTTNPPVTPSRNLNGDLSMTRTLGLKVGKVVLDPGHGGKDTGTIGPGGLKEKDLVLAVALRLKTLLEERLGTDVILTRNRDVFVPLEERTAIANQQGADLFISIHANSSRNHRVSGVETFILNFASSAEEREVASRENAGSQRNIRDLEDLLKKIALGDYNEESSDLAHVVQTELYKGLRRFRSHSRNRGVKKAPFIVLIGSNMPSILTEIGFISNPADERFFRKNQSRLQVAEALYKGIEEYFRSLGAIPMYERAAAANEK